MALCEKDIVYWVNNFVWTHDPRLKSPYIPMILFDVQAEFLLFLEDCENNTFDAVVEKSRDMGVTWLCCIFLVHHWLFKPGFKGAIGSRKEDLVDKSDDPDSIFHKIRSIIDKLPRWMIPNGFNRNRHDKHLNIINPQNGAVITGEAGDQMGRGGRNSVYFVDEHAFVERSQLVEAALSQNSAIRVYVSTPNGNGNLFYQKRQQAIRNPNGSVKLFRFHWKKDPRKNYYEIYENEKGKRITVYPWYEAVKERVNNPVIIAQEVDIDFGASIEGTLIPLEFIEAAVGFADWLYKHESKLLPYGDTMAGYDIADGGSAENVIGFARGVFVYEFQSWDGLNTWQSTTKVVRLCNNKNVKSLQYDGSGIGSSIGANLTSAGLGQKFSFCGFNGGSSPTNRRWPTANDKVKTSRDMFPNLRSEEFWLLRLRFERTYEYRVLGIKHDLNTLISIPDIPKLKDQLNSILCTTTDGGKIKVESKREMKDRNVPSPDWADALMYIFATRRERKIDNKVTTSQWSG